MGRLAALAIAFASIAHAPGATWPGPPGARAPDTGSGPPPAWVETHTRSLWLAQSSYCWRSGSRSICADFAPPQYRTGIPTLRVHRGATVRIHFGFTPRSVSAVRDPARPFGCAPRASSNGGRRDPGSSRSSSSRRAVTRRTSCA